MNQNILKGHIAIFLSCIIFATNIIVSSELMGTWMTPMGYTLTRLLFGTVAIWGISMFLPKEKVESKDLLVLAVGGVLGFIVSQFAFALALQYTTPVNYSLIMAMAPIMVLILSVIFLKEGVNLKRILGILLSIVGAFIIILQRGDGGAIASNNTLGIFIAFISMSSYGIYLMINRKVTQKYTSVTILKWMFLFTAIMLFPFGISDLLEQRIYTPEVTLVPVLQLAFILIFDVTIVFFMLLFALNKLKTTTVTTYLNLLPVFTAVIAIFNGQEMFTLSKVIAIVLVVGGVFLVTMAGEKTEVTEELEEEQIVV